MASRCAALNNFVEPEIYVLFLTDNPTLGGTVNILKGWFHLGRAQGLRPVVALPPGSKFAQWLAAERVPFLETSMPWPDRSWPVPGLLAACRLAGWARRQGVAVLHCNEHNVYPFALQVRLFLRRPLVCHVRYRIEPGFAHWAFGGRRQPDALLWTSRQQRDDSAAAIRGVVPEARQHILPLGLDLAMFGQRADDRPVTRSAWGFRPDAIILGQCCALRPRKRVTEFIDLVARLAREDDRVVGVLAGDAMPGDEPYREIVLRHLQASGLGERFRWLGNLDDVEPFYQALDVFVSTSEYETFGNSVCEAMACRCPVAAYKGGSVQEVVGDAGLVVETLDLEGLTAAVRRLVADPGLRLTLGERGYQRVEQCFNPSRSLHQLLDIYRSLHVAARVAW